MGAISQTRCCKGLTRSGRVLYQKLPLDTPLASTDFTDSTDLKWPAQSQVVRRKGGGVVSWPPLPAPSKPAPRASSMPPGLGCEHVHVRPLRIEDRTAIDEAAATMWDEDRARLAGRGQ